MGVFSDTIRLTVDVVAGQTQSFKGFVSNLKRDVGEAEGSFGKLKAVGGGAMDFISNNAGALAAGAGAAIASFAASAVGDFQDLAASVGSLRDSLGLSAEDASRWVEVADDLGIGAAGLETAMAKMLKTAGSSPQVFDDLSVQIARTKDGTVDANGTFLNVIDRLNGMKDPAERAAAAQQLLGKAWRDSAELIGLGADGVRERLEEVSGAKILSDEQISDSREFRDTMDDLTDRVDNVKLALAQGLVPILTEVAGVVGPVIDGFGKMRDAAETLADVPVAGWFVNNVIHPLENAKKAFDLLPTDDDWHDTFLGEGADDITASVGKLPTALNEVKIAAAGITVQQKAAKLTTDENIAAYTEMGAGLHKLAVETEAYEAAAADLDQVMSSSDWGKTEIEGALTANHQFSEQLFALPDIAAAGEEAIDKFGDSMRDADGKVQAASLTFDLNTEAGRKQQDALKDIASTLDVQFAGAFDAADGDMATFMGSANRISNDTLKRLQSEFGLSDKQVDQLRDSLGLTAKDWSARFELSGTAAAKEQVGLLQSSIASVTDKNWQAKIATLIAQGDYVSVVNEVQSYYNRHPATIPTRVVPAAGGRLSAIGGTIPQSGTWAGEYGPEFIADVGGTSKVVPRAASANIPRSNGDSYTININGKDAREGIFEFERWMWLRNAQPGRNR